MIITPKRTAINDRLQGPSSNNPMYLYAVVLLMSQRRADSVRLNALPLYCGSCRRKFAGIMWGAVCGLPIFVLFAFVPHLPPEREATGAPAEGAVTAEP